MYESCQTFRHALYRGEIAVPRGSKEPCWCDWRNGEGRVQSLRRDGQGDTPCENGGAIGVPNEGKGTV